MKRILSLTVLVAVALVALLPAASSARTSPTHGPPTICEKAYGVRQQVIKKHGKRAPGRNICRFGVKTKRGERPAVLFERAKYLRQLRNLVKPPPVYLVRTAVAPYQAPAGTATSSIAAGGTLAQIAACESGGDPTAVSPNGQYRGKYQFSRSTWQSVGGVGDPAAAPEAVQDALAARLLATGGPGHWPVCGR